MIGQGDLKTAKDGCLSQSDQYLSIPKKPREQTDCRFMLDLSQNLTTLQDLALRVIRRTKDRLEIIDSAPGQPVT
jgi:hypothetical protein